MKKLTAMILLLLIVVSLAACEAPEEKNIQPKEKIVEIHPEETQMKAICELAVMECYYHNVAKFIEEDAEGILWWTKDKQFWIEYSGIVKLGVDVSRVKMELQDTQVSITIPKAEVQSCKVDSSTLTKESYYVGKNSAKITAEDEIMAFQQAQDELMEKASNDAVLMAEAQQQAQTLLEEYITNIGKAIGKDYTIRWIYLDD